MLNGMIQGINGVSPPPQKDDEELKRQELIRYLEERQNASDSQHSMQTGLAGLGRAGELINQGLTGVAPDDISYQQRLKRADTDRSSRQALIKDYMAKKLAGEQKKAEQDFKTGQLAKEHEFKAGAAETKFGYDKKLQEMKSASEIEAAKAMAGIKEDAASKKASKAEAVANKSKAAQAESMIGKIDEAIKFAEGDWSTGFGSGVIGTVLPDSGAGRLASRLETIRANLGLDKLIEIKKQGGSMGALSDKEFAALQAASENLRQTQNKEDLIQNLKYLQDNYKKIQDAIASNAGGGPSPVQAQTKVIGGKTYRKVPGGWETDED